MISWILGIDRLNGMKRFGAFVAFIAVALSAKADLQLRYDRPATCFEETLVIGNGNLGAAVYGGVQEDRLSLNDLTLWTGEPSWNKVYSPNAWVNLERIRMFLDQEDYAHAEEAIKAVQGDYTQNYQPLGNLLLTDLAAHPDEGNPYCRTLQLDSAIARVSCGNLDRTYFVSAPDSVIVIYLKGRNGATIHERIGLNSLLPVEVKCTREGDLQMSGYVAYASSPSYTSSEMMLHNRRGIHFCTKVRVLPLGGGEVLPLNGQALELKNCTEALILVSNVTSFNGRFKDPVKEGRDYMKAVGERIEKAARKPYARLLQQHVDDFSKFFNRVSLNLGTTDPAIAALPTDVQLRKYTEEKQANPDLEELYFQFGRYLLISCSRTEGVPANLQGLWNEHLLPPWSCNYTTNINLEENYWPAEVANLTEMHRPMLDFVQSLPPSGEISARNYYNVQKGWCLGHNSDIWGLTNPVGRRGGDPSWANWNMGGAWVSTHLWEHYSFTLDRDFLSRAYPVLKGAADFCLGWMVGKDGYLLTSPCTTPENRYVAMDVNQKTDAEGRPAREHAFVGGVFYGGFADLAMIRECLLDTRAAARELGIDAAYQDSITAALDKLLPYRIGQRGNLQEFYHDWEGEDPYHRHQSHLFGLYPGHHITVEGTPDLAKACARTLEIKGPRSTGWSTGWRVNLQARLRDAEKAYQTYRMLLTFIDPHGRGGGGTYPNLLDAHSPFQIDGNFGGCAGVMEMLMQSEYKASASWKQAGQQGTSTVLLLPALPEAWKAEGEVKGLCARGGFVLDFAWKNGRITSLKVASRRPTRGICQIRCGAKSWKVSLNPGDSKQLQ